MSSFVKKGRIFKISDVNNVTANFKKREFVIETTEDRYPQKVLFNLINSKVDVIDYYKEGDEISVSFNIRGKEWQSPSGESKYFNSLDAWKVERLNSNGYSDSEPERNFEPPFESNSNEEDDVPF